MVHQKQVPMACPAMGACFWFARSEDENSCEGDRRLRRKQGAGAGAAVAEAAARSRGARRCGNRNPQDGAAAPEPTVRWTVGQPAGESPGNAAVSRI